jgi:hypothetical protein
MDAVTVTEEEIEEEAEELVDMETENDSNEDGVHDIDIVVVVVGEDDIVVEGVKVIVMVTEFDSDEDVVRVDEYVGDDVMEGVAVVVTDVDSVRLTVADMENESVGDNDTLTDNVFDRDAVVDDDAVGDVDTVPVAVIEVDDGDDNVLVGEGD